MSYRSIVYEASPAGEGQRLECYLMTRPSREQLAEAASAPDAVIRGIARTIGTFRARCFGGCGAELDPHSPPAAFIVAFVYTPRFAGRPVTSGLCARCYAAHPERTGADWHALMHRKLMGDP